MQEFRVSSHSDSNKIAGALSAFLRAGESVNVLVVGAGAVNQAIKGIATCRGDLITQGIEITCAPAYFTTEFSGEIRTGLQLLVSGR